MRSHPSTPLPFFSFNFPDSLFLSLFPPPLPQLEPLRAWSQSGKPSWGTCAGMIMFAERAEGQKAGGQALLGGLDITVSRNYFGSQTSSFEAPLELVPSDAALVGAGIESSRGVFIRAPAILQCGAGVRPLAYVRVPRKDAQVPLEVGSSGGVAAAAAAAAGEVPPVCVAAASDAFLVTAFHPELSEGAGWHRLFVDMVERHCGGGVKLGRGVGGEGKVEGASMIGVTLPVGFDTDATTSGNKNVYDVSRRVVTGEAPWL
jgi:glutamine amidotransferase PdxT